MRVRLGSQQYYSSRSHDPHGNWNEGFLFTISYHNQLFDTIELDLYDRKKGWRSKTKHIGKAKLKIAKLKHHEDVFLTFVPMYEYHTKRYLPAHIQLPHNFLKANMPNFPSLPHPMSKKNGTANPVQEHYLHYEQHPSHRKHSMTPFIGSIQIRIRYQYQHPDDSLDHSTKPVYLPYNASKEVDPSSPSRPVSLHPHSSQATSLSSHTMLTMATTQATDDDDLSSSDNDSMLDNASVCCSLYSTASALDSQPPRSTPPTKQVQADEPPTPVPDVVVSPTSPTHPPDLEPEVKPSKPDRAWPFSNTRLRFAAAQSLSASSSASTHRIINRASSTSMSSRTSSVRSRASDCSSHSAMSPSAGFGFSRCDDDRRHALLSRHGLGNNHHDGASLFSDRDSAISDSASIRSNNFGDKNFAFRWINENFEEVALSHPSLDRMIGMVVSPQTRILVRAVVKMMNAFGQGFKITSVQLFSSLSMLQKFYNEIPRSPPPASKVTDLRFLDEAHYFLGHAIIAYGWRGISYLGDYAKYLKDVMKTRSNKLAIVRFLKMPPEDLLGYEYGLRKGAVFQPSYFVSVDRGHEAIVLGIRGTWSLYDVITDLVCDYKPWKGGLVHSGMLASAQWFFTRIVPQIFHYIHQQCKQDKPPHIKSFIITGHSLGAGTAAILTMMIADHMDELLQISGNPNFRLHCYSYAPVASVSLDISEKYKDYVDSFVCHDDLVARLSYGTASCTKELVMDALIAADGLGGITKVNHDQETRRQCFDIISTRRQEIFQANEPRYPLLYVPGRVFQFRRRPIPARPPPQRRASVHEPAHPLSSHGQAHRKPSDASVDFTLHESSALLSEEMLITKTCLEDHMLVTYLKAFQTARENCMRDSHLEKSSAPSSSPTPDQPPPSILLHDPDGQLSSI
ncbi:hypothetical protein DM01DRAFT_1211570 [Hesseltinella vesiculosa]|uniref:sn-1-specific diacylglycerol lipase n=1 Tax=Hesseltinella vesiculosa TaxID=101127 RepID=A0A1X2GQK2_9FUNG|nr:hypothetical protein DM01DRAFT_1211570 [Hesseltinella vesiculosa]